VNDEDNAIPNVLKYIAKYYLPIFLCSSLIGNSLSVYILFCMKIRNSSSSIYNLGVLAMSDIGMMALVNWFRERNIINKKD